MSGGPWWGSGVVYKLRTGINWWGSYWGKIIEVDIDF